MLTYQFQKRIFRIANDANLLFPNEVEIEFKLSPSTSFGADNSPSRTILRGRKANLKMNANTGKWEVLSDPPLERLVLTMEKDKTKFSLNGDSLIYSFYCERLSELNSYITLFNWIYPSLLNIDFLDPPIVIATKGKVGQLKFNWELNTDEWRIQTRTISVNELKESIKKSYNYLSLFEGIKNRRLAAALKYFHTAVRLNRCGYSAWEFMAEAILNYSKCLEILFVTSENSRDDARKELKKLGLVDEEIEGDFIPLLVLRSFFDVAHPKIKIASEDDYKTIYDFLVFSEDNIRNLFKILLTKINNGSYTLLQDSNLTLDSEDKKGLKNLMEILESRVVKFSNTTTKLIKPIS